METNENEEISEKEDKVVIPEFYRDLKRDEGRPGVWHYAFRTVAGTRKPIATPDGLPHKLPTAWETIFGNTNPRIEIEVGSGKGGFLIEYAAKHPEINVLGSEWDATWAFFAARRMVKHDLLKNSQMLRGDIFYYLRDCAPENSVDAFHMYFPDPWPKERHHKNRLLRPEFLELVLRALKPGTHPFYWGTDHAEYNEIALDVFDHFKGAEIVERNTALPTEGIMTNFEKKYRKEGRPIYRSVISFTK
jgi:tRNA (guanine-N7-)-methyltransferase